MKKIAIIYVRYQGSPISGFKDVKLHCNALSIRFVVCWRSYRTQVLCREVPRQTCDLKFGDIEVTEHILFVDSAYFIEVYHNKAAQPII